MYSARKWMYFPIPVHYKFRTWQSLEPLAPLLGEIDMRTHWVFCGKLNNQQLLLAMFFWFNRYFLQHSVLKWIYFPNQYIIIFQTWKCLEPPSSTPWGDRLMRPLSFLYQIYCLTTFIRSISDSKFTFLF